MITAAHLFLIDRLSTFNLLDLDLGRPVVLTINGKAQLVVEDAESYQKLLEAKDRMEAIEGIKRGLEGMKRNAGKPAEMFFQLFTEKASQSANETYAVVFEESAQADVRDS